MRIPLVIDALKELVERADHSWDEALSVLGSAEFLLQFLLKAAQVNDIANMLAVKECVRDVQNFIYWKAGLISNKASSDPKHYADMALNKISYKTIMGPNPLLLERDINNDGEIMSE